MTVFFVKGIETLKRKGVPYPLIAWRKRDQTLVSAHQKSWRLQKLVTENLPFVVCRQFIAGFRFVGRTERLRKPLTT
jgi:hypothetical protein